MIKLLNLIGDPEENFYQLGLIDKEEAEITYSLIKAQISTPWKTVNTALEELTKNILKKTPLLNQKSSYLNAYSEGLGLDYRDVHSIMLIPEFMNLLSKWAPFLTKGPLGNSFTGSSFFMRNESFEVVHGRILDFPVFEMGKSSTFSQRGILYDFKGMPKVMGFGMSGLPFPSLTFMTEDGITLALGQKNSDFFNPDGTLIFELIFDMIKNARDKKSILEYLQNHSSISHWGLNIGFKNGDCLDLDLLGSNIQVREYAITQDDIYYFGNHKESADKKIAHLLKTKKRNENELIKAMATPYHLLDKTPISFHTDTISGKSTSVITMNSSNQSALYLSGEIPKIFKENAVALNDCFNGPQESILLINKKIKSKSNADLTDYQLGLKALMEAQSGFDKNDSQVVYHQLQFAIDHLEHFPEKKIATFYFLLAQYIYETHPKILNHILIELTILEAHLPIQLSSMASFFINRLEFILSGERTKEVTTAKLKKILELDLLIPRPIFHLVTKKLIIPRIDLWDVFYLSDF